MRILQLQGELCEKNFYKNDVGPKPEPTPETFITYLILSHSKDSIYQRIAYYVLLFLKPHIPAIINMDPTTTSVTALPTRFMPVTIIAVAPSYRTKYYYDLVYPEDK